MIERIFVRRYIKIQHQTAPLLREREDYLRHLVEVGRKTASLQNAATILLHVVRVMDFSALRCVDETEIKEAGNRWALEYEPHRMQRGNKSSAARFVYTARDWMRFQRLLVVPTPPELWFDSALKEFVEAMSLRISPLTIQDYARRARAFLTWLSARRSQLPSATIQDIDDFLSERLSRGIRPTTLAGECKAIRAFFNYARSRGWCEGNFIRSIRNPVPHRYQLDAKGPAWRDVRKVIKSVNGTTVADYRAKAILLLCAVYGLRESEVERLSLSDFDWRSETFIVRRAKHGRTQQFPIQYEVGQAIILYLRHGRPQCQCRNLFVTQNAPYRPLQTLWPIVSRRMKKLKIQSKHFGAHSLRHACATELLRKGTPLRDIADFLGHRDVRSVTFYARYDVRSLRDVANFSLAGIL